MSKFDEIERMVRLGDTAGPQKMLADALQEAKDAPTSIVSTVDGVKFKRRGRYVEQIDGKWVPVQKKKL